MTVFRWNVIANFVGNLWIILLSLVSIPLVVHFLGVESYGVVGFSATLFSVFALLDFGLGAALNKAAAQLDIAHDDPSPFRNLVRSLELIYWVMGFFLGVIVFLAAPFLVRHWLNATTITSQSLENSIKLIGVMVGLRWPMPLYFSGLMGLERQVLVNKVKISFETLRIVGSVCAIWLIDASIQTFFIFQIISIIIFLPIAAVMLWKYIPASNVRPKFDLSQLRNIRSFAAGMAGISITSAVLMQLDKVLLSGLLNLKDFGYYTLASSAALVLFQFVSPVSTAIFPKLAQLSKTQENDNKDLLRETYHKASQLVSFLVFPAAFMAIFFAKELLILWTQSPVVAEHSASILAVLVTGNLLNSMMLIPYALQLAYGWVGLPLKVNLVSILILPPLVFLGAFRFGGVGAASAWVALNAGYFLISIPIMHRRLLVGQQFQWYFNDILPIFFNTIFFAVLAKLCRPFVDSMIGLSLFLASTYLIMVLAAGIMTPVIRNWVLSKIHDRKFSIKRFI